MTNQSIMTSFQADFFHLLFLNGKITWRVFEFFLLPESESIEHNINDPFAIAVYKEITAKLGLGHIQVATIVDGNITLLEGSLGSCNDTLTQSF